MIDILWFTAAIAAAFACALATPLVWLRGIWAAFATAISVALLVCCPLLAPADNMYCRALAALFAGDQILKVIDFCRLRIEGEVSATYRDYAAFFVAIALFVRRLRKSPLAFAVGGPDLARAI